MEMPCNFFLLVKTSISCYSIELFLTYIFKAYFCCWFIFLFLSCIETSGSSLWRSCSMSANYFNLFFSQYLQIIFLQLLPYSKWFQMLPSTPFPWKLPFSHPLQASFLSSLGSFPPPFPWKPPSSHPFLLGPLLLLVRKVSLHFRQ